MGLGGLGIALGAGSQAYMKSEREAEELEYLREQRAWQREQKDRDRKIDEELGKVAQTSQPVDATPLDEIGMMGRFGINMEDAQMYSQGVRDKSLDPNKLASQLQVQSGGTGPVFGMRGADGGLSVANEAPKARPFADIARDQALVMLKHGGREYLPQAVGMLEKTYSLHKQELEKRVGDAMRMPSEEDRIKSLASAWSDTSHIPGKIEYQVDKKTGAVTVSAKDGDQVTLPPKTFTPVRGSDGSVMTPSQQMYEQMLGSFSFDNYVKLGTLQTARDENQHKNRYYDSYAGYLDRSAGKGGSGSSTGYKGRPVVTQKNDEGGFVAFDANTGAPVYNVSGSGAIMPLGMNQAEFGKIQKQAGEFGIEVATGMGNDGRVTVGFRGRDGRTYTTMDEAKKAKPQAGGEGGAPQPEPAAKKGGLPTLPPEAEKIGAELDSARAELGKLGNGPGLKQQKADPNALPSFLKRKSELESRVKTLGSQYESALPSGMDRAFTR